MPNIANDTNFEYPGTLPVVRCLSQVRAGECGRVMSVHGEPHLAVRILELGLVSGTPFRVLRCAPLGGPMEVEIEGSLLSLRRSEADAVRVE
jgi:ferrous iron transport protein A